LKPERLFLRTVHTTTSVDSTFLKDIIRVSLFSDLLVLKFKQSCIKFLPQNDQIEVLDFQTPNSEILNPESPYFLNSNSWIPHEGKMPQDDTNPRFQFIDGLLYYQGLLYILDDPCQLQVLQSRHDFPITGYFGFNKT
jgi:hypothetical protein